MKRLAILTTHPIQYYAPLFRLLTANENIAVKVFYSWGEASLEKFDPGFNKSIKWDIPLTTGYDFAFLKNTSKQPGSHHYQGIENPDVLAELQSFNPHALLVFGWCYKSHLKVMRFFKNKIPVWFRGDSTLLDEVNLLKKIGRNLFLRWVYSHVDKVFYVGSNNKKYFTSMGISNKKLIFAPHAVDNNFFSTIITHSNKLRESLGIDSKDILILFAGKFERKKNPSLLLEAFIDMNASNTHLLFVGNGQLEPELKDRARPYAKNIHFLDFQNQLSMPAIYQACNLFCLPSCGPGETWGLAVNEAMAAGKAIIISDKVGCGSDLVKKGQNGDIFESNDKNALLSALIKLNNFENLYIMGVNSSNIIKSWTLEATVASLSKELNAL